MMALGSSTGRGGLPDVRVGALTDRMPMGNPPALRDLSSGGSVERDGVRRPFVYASAAVGRSRTLTIVGVLVLFAACDAPSAAADHRTIAATPGGATITIAAADPTLSPAATSSGLRLSGGVGSAAIAAVRTEAARQKLTGVQIARAQSFRIMRARRETASLVTGRATVPGAANAGCFVAIVHGTETMLIQTIGYADYEAETCSGPVAIGLLSTGDPIKFGFVFAASSPNAEVYEPIVIDWDRGDNTLLIDDALSTKASLAGAQTIAAIKKLL